MKRVISVNANGQRVGESHQRAKLTDHEVDQIRELHESGEYGYRKLARMFEVSRSLVRYIVKCRCRAQIVAGFREVQLPD